MDGPLAVSPPAKINLHLEVLGRRNDDYHEIRTLYQSIDLRDRLTAEIAPDGELALEVRPTGVIDGGDDNLVIRAARLVSREIGVGPGVRFTLDKNIPVGTGLGGGSADAAAALKLLDRLWDCGFDEERLHRLAAALGSDVPFFLHGGLAVGTGRGDELVKLPDRDDLALVVVAPDIRVSTREAFRLVDPRLTSTRPKGNVDAVVAGFRGRPDWRVMANELEHVVVKEWPVVGEGLRLLRDQRPIFASLSGSGAASYALFEDHEAARHAATALPAGWFVHVGSTIGRSAARLEVGRVDHGGFG
jgi:4-diphosphocytidyl-2-C-methyl-D-erythritol kinase